MLRQQPAHGYQLQRSFAAGGDLAAVLPMEQATLYGTLKELAARGLIAGAESREGSRPPKVVYALTPAGGRALRAWLAEPVERLRQVRLDFLLKVYFARRQSKALVRALVDAQLETCRRYLSDLEAKDATLESASFASLVIGSRTSAARSTLEWLREYRRGL